MPELTKKQITQEDLGVELLIEAGLKAASVADWKKKAAKYIKAKMIQVVDAEGNEIDATLVINAVAPTEAELAEDKDAIEGKMEDEDEKQDYEEMKAVLPKLAKGILAEARRETDARIKSIKVIGPRNDDKQKCGFKHFGEFCTSVKDWALTQTRDPRLLADRIMKGPDKDGIQTKAPTTFGSAGIGADGGFLIPDEFRASINEYVFGDQALLPLTDVVTVSGNTLVVPRDETTPWGSDGVQAKWVGETGTLTQSKPKLGENTIKLNKLAVLVPMTEELVSDSAVGIESYLNSKVGPKIDFAVSDAIINGDGNGKPDGIINSGALVTIAKEGSQTADTIVTANLLKMMSGLHVLNASSVRWLHHRTAFPQIASLTLGDQPMYIPAGRISETPGGSLLGYGLLGHQACQIVGDLNDILAIDFSAYQSVVKGEGVRQDMSIHLYFDTDDLAFRYVFRVGGQPKFTAPITDNNGSGTSSPFVTLAARA